MAAGARLLHMHPRDAAGVQTLDATHCAAALRAIRAATPGIPVGLSTGAFIEPDPDRRRSLLRAWTERPDYCSVNLPEPGAIELCRQLQGMRIGVEAGLETVADAELLRDSGFGRHCLRVLIEVAEPEGAAAVATAAAIEAVLDAGRVEAPRLHHGYDGATWWVISAALSLGRDVRVGLEDTLQLPDGSRAAGNADLVAAAVALRDLRA